jgi:homoserine O-succinyltransferase
MPVSLNSFPSRDNRQSCANKLCANPSSECLDRASRQLTIGLINNMPDGALEATENQFISLLASISDDISINLQLYALPGVPRGEAGTDRIRTHYSDVVQLWNSRLDALIVTGREPLSANLADEPYWDSFTRLLEWAHANTSSTIWSCLAAHAAVFHMDGIARVKSDRKHSGIYQCARVLDHWLMAGAPSRFCLPHSRWNGLSEEHLLRSGYSVLTRAGHAGVDTFVKQNGSLFVFFQGHPEYESHTLLLEYRRDVARYLCGEAGNYPSLPCGYFDDETTAALADLAHEARLFPREELLVEVASVLDRAAVLDSWRPTAACMYQNWLHYLCAQKRQRLEDRLCRAAIPSSDALAGGANSRTPVAVLASGLR